MKHKYERSDEGVSDEDLILLARAADKGAFAELWHRHSRAGMSVARHFSSSIDPEDLVSEAFARIYERVLAGGGPEGAFRPYLYTTIRNLASRWGASRKDVNVDDMTEFEDPDVADDPATTALDRTLTARAFRTLPDRWQRVLWYTEIEGMDPHEVAPILGMSANGVAALAYRAREGLRKAWLQAHVSDATASGECAWAIARLGDHARHGLTDRDTERVNCHLANCSKCSTINEEVDAVGSRLALVTLPLILGGTVGGAVLASLASPGSATAAAIAPTAPALVAGSTAAVVAPSAVAGLSLVAPLVGTVAIALAVTGGIAVTSTVAPETQPVSTSIAAADAATTPPLAASSAADDSFVTALGGTLVDRNTGVAAGLGGAVEGVVGADGTVSALTNGVGTTVNGVTTGLGSTVNGVTSGLGSTLSGTTSGLASGGVSGAVGGLTDGVGTTLSGTTAGLGSTVNGVTSGLTGTVNGVVTSLTNPINALIPSLVPSAPATPAPVAPTAVSLDLSGTATPLATVVVTVGSVSTTTAASLSGAWSVHLTGVAPSASSVGVHQSLVSVLGLSIALAPITISGNSLGLPVTVN